MAHEYQLLWRSQRGDIADDDEVALNYLNEVDGWRCVGFVGDGRGSGHGHFILERDRDAGPLTGKAHRDTADAAHAARLAHWKPPPNG